MTTTDDLRFDHLRAVLDADEEDESDISVLRFLRPNPHECRTTRAALHDYLNRNLQPRRQRRLETHLYGCDACIRAFIDIREVAWSRRAAGLATPTTPTGTDDNAPRLKGPIRAPD